MTCVAPAGVRRRDPRGHGGEVSVATLTVREPATQAERNLDTASGLLGAALVCLAAERAYRETEGRPWAERIAARKVADEARATLARLMGGE